MRRMGILVLPMVVVAWATTSGYAAVTDWRYDLSTGKIYGLTSSGTWTAAEAESVATGGHLVTIDNAAENKWVQATFPGYYWIGLYDDSANTGLPDPPGDWFWASSGAPPTYTNWNSGEPNGASEDHAAIRGDGRWNDLAETSARRGVFEMDGTYPIDRLRFNPATGNVYARSQASVPWTEAEFGAQAAGGHLVTLNDQAENNWVQANFGNVWIGLTDDETYGGTEFGNTSGESYPPDGNRGAGWVWTSGEAVSFQNWRPGEPNNSGNEDYAEIASDGGWNDLRTTHTRPGLVEIPIGASLDTYRYNPATQHIYAKTNNLTWANAELVAKALGANLVTVNDDAENTWVAGTMGTGWIGFNDAGDEGHWTWTSGTGGDWTLATRSGSSYAKWNHPESGGTGTEPNGGTGENYGMIYSSTLWNDAGATYASIGGIIEFPTALTIGNYQYNPITGNVYARTNSVPWEDAERMAQVHGGHLVTIENAVENDWVRNQMGAGWIGFHDTNKRDVWEWASGTGGTWDKSDPGAATSFVKWNHPDYGGTGGEPNGGDTENYGEVMSNGLWNDLSTQSRAGNVEFNVTDYRYNPFTQHVYARTDTMAWAMAQAIARGAGADLVTVNDGGENDWLHATYGGGWIGLTDDDAYSTEGTFVWASGQGVAYTNWRSGEPNNSGNEDYGEMAGDGGWNDLGDTQTRSGIIEFPATLEGQAAHFNPATGKVYIKSNSTTWANAELFAKALGGHLATIHNAAENEYVAAATRGGWIGFNDIASEGNFTWVSGDPSTYSNWASGEPNNSGGVEDVTTMRSNGQWNDYSTQSQQGIIELDGTYSVTQYKYNPATQHVYARTNSVNWQTGYAVAQAAGGDLVNLADDAENTWVQNNYSGSGWIGLMDVAGQTGAPDPPGLWVWTDGSPATYQKWYNPAYGAPGGNEPNGSREDHAHLRGDSYWNDLSGDRSLPAVVEFPDTVPGTGLTGQRYNPATNKLYALTSDTATWRAAMLIARVNGGELVTVHDAAENEWIRTTVAAGDTRWIGFTDDGHEGGWVWASGEGGAWIQGVGGSSYTNWNAPPQGSGSEPNGGTGENFAAIYTSGLWNDYGDSRQLQGIVDLGQARSAQWRFNPGSGKLNAQTDYLIWEDAQLQAENWGGRLATVPNAAANEFIRANWGGGWIGLNDRDSEGNFQWVSGQPVTYTNWAAGEPNDWGGNEDYTTMRSNGEWNDYGPANYQYGIAERDATPPRWIFNPDTGRWYARTANLTWADAEAQAQYWGVHLATINDQDEHDYVAGRFLNTWIGLTDDETYGGTEFGNTSGESYPPAGNRGAGWVWASGEAATYQNWRTGEPNDAGNEDYAQIRADGWNDYGVRYLDGVAEGDTDDVRATAEYRDDGPSGGVRYAILGQMTWEEAEAAAQELGGHLVTVRNQAENDFLQQLAEELQGNIWLGYNDAAVEDDWVWASGAFTPYTNWNAGEPNDAGAGEDYAAMYYGSGLWNDVGSTTMYYAIVEFVPEPATFVLAAIGLGLLGALGWRRRPR